jgi:putative ABC transport system permease protein
MALGAKPARVRGMVIRQGMLLVGAGLVAGLVAAYYLAAVSATLFGVEAHDVAVFVTIPAVLAMVSLAAVAIPAARASRVDPLAAVRSE